jgi:hypothetical protein
VAGTSFLVFTLPKRRQKSDQYEHNLKLDGNRRAGPVQKSKLGQYKFIRLK